MRYLNSTIILLFLSLLAACGGGGGGGAGGSGGGAGGNSVATATAPAAPVVVPTATTAVPCGGTPVPNGTFKVSFTNLTAIEITEATRAFTNLNNYLGVNLISRDDATGIPVTWDYETHVDQGLRDAGGFIIYSDESATPLITYYQSPSAVGEPQFSCDSAKGASVWTGAAIRLSIRMRAYFETTLQVRAPPQGYTYSVAKPLSIYFEFFKVFMKMAGFNDWYNEWLTIRPASYVLTDPNANFWFRYDPELARHPSAEFDGLRHIGMSADFNTWYPAP